MGDVGTRAAAGSLSCWPATGAAMGGPGGHVRH